MNKGLLYFINIYNQGITHKFSKIKLRRFRNVILLCSFLQKNGLITGYTIIDSNLVEISLASASTYKLQVLVGKTKTFCNPKAIDANATRIAVSTPKGFMTLMRAREQKISAVKLFCWE